MFPHLGADFLLANLMYCCHVDTCHRSVFICYPLPFAFRFLLVRYDFSNTPGIECTVEGVYGAWQLHVQYTKKLVNITTQYTLYRRHRIKKVKRTSMVQQILGSIMPVSAGDSWVALSSKARNPVLAYMVATLQVSRVPVERRWDESRRETGDTRTSGV